MLTFIRKITTLSVHLNLTLESMTASFNPRVVVLISQKRLHTYVLKMYGSAGCEAAISGAVMFALAESDLAGGGGFTLVETRPKVLEQRMEFLPAESDTHFNKLIQHNY